MFRKKRTEPLRRAPIKVPRIRPGTRPGALGEDEDFDIKREAQFHVTDFDSGRVTTETYDKVEDALCWAKSDKVTWIHVAGDVTPSILRALREAYGLHSLAVEDVLNQGQRPKQEDYDGQLFMTMALPNEVDEGLEAQQVSLFLLDHNFVLSFYSGDFELFEPVRQRINEGKGLIRQAGADYLFYALVDVVVDSGFPLLDKYSQRLEQLEDDIFEERQADPIATIHAIKRDLIGLRKVFWAQSLMLGDLLRSSHPLIGEVAFPYFRDCVDHADKIMDLLESYRDMAASLLDTHLSLVSNRMNDIMKVLTLMSTIFIPLSFIVGLYGMNFDTESAWNMPELAWRYGYLFVWSVILITVIGLVVFFRRRKWL